MNRYVDDEWVDDTVVDEWVDDVDHDDTVVDEWVVDVDRLMMNRYIMVEMYRKRIKYGSKSIGYYKGDISG